ncbi:MAG TPA: hypothetical protein VFV50_17375 [Bdellovibrionales bacterium]|nr:hypothetical protein [Bdellovibrionales bacterium]
MRLAILILIVLFQGSAVIAAQKFNIAPLELNFTRVNSLNLGANDTFVLLNGRQEVARIVKTIRRGRVKGLRRPPRESLVEVDYRLEYNGSRLPIKITDQQFTSISGAFTHAARTNPGTLTYDFSERSLSARLANPTRMFMIAKKITLQGALQMGFEGTDSQGRKVTGLVNCSRGEPDRAGRLRPAAHFEVRTVEGRSSATTRHNFEDGRLGCEQTLSIVNTLLPARAVRIEVDLLSNEVVKVESGARGRIAAGNTGSS